MPDYLDFDFDATQRDAWGQFTERLDMVLSVMDATEDLNISVAGAPEPRPGLHYSVDQPKVVTASFAGSNAGVATAQEALGLRELGWGDPVGGEYQVAMAQESSKQLARLSSQTLSEVLGVLHPVFLEPDQLVEILQGGEPGRCQVVEAMGGCPRRSRSKDSRGVRKPSVARGRSLSSSAIAVR